LGYQGEGAQAVGLVSCWCLPCVCVYRRRLLWGRPCLAASLARRAGPAAPTRGEQRRARARPARGATASRPPRRRREASPRAPAQGRHHAVPVPRRPRPRRRHPSRAVGDGAAAPTHAAGRHRPAVRRRRGRSGRRRRVPSDARVGGWRGGRPTGRGGGGRRRPRGGCRRRCGGTALWRPSGGRRPPAWAHLCRSSRSRPGTPRFGRLRVRVTPGRLADGGHERARPGDGASSGLRGEGQAG